MLVEIVHNQKFFKIKFICLSIISTLLLKQKFHMLSKDRVVCKTTVGKLIVHLLFRDATNTATRKVEKYNEKKTKQ